MKTLLIIGGGASGLAAAVRSRELGVERVILLERNNSVGGNGLQAGMIFAGDSRLQKRTETAIDPVQLYRDVRHQLNNTGDGKIIHDYVFTTGKVVDWLEGKGIDMTARKGPNGVTIVSSTEQQPNGSRLGSLYTKAMLSACHDLGVELHTGSHVKSIRPASNGNWVVITTNGESFEGQSVILATGGLAGSAEALKKYYPEFFDMETEPCANSIPSCDGCGIEMAESLGAETGKGMGMFLKGPAFIGSQHLQKLLSSPKALWVSKAGARFIDESESRAASEAMNQLPSRVVYAIYDHPTLNLVADETKNDPGMGIPVPGTLDEHLERAVKNGRVIKADSVEELASGIGANAARLESTIRRYNDFCSHGEDLDMAKDSIFLKPIVQGPFYAIRGDRFSDSSQGGIRVTSDLKIADASGNALGNVFAVGDHVSGWCSQHYAPPGGGFTWAITSGYMAAEYTAKGAQIDGVL